MHNMGLFGGSVIRIVRYSLDWIDNFCGPIFFEKNTF